MNNTVALTLAALGFVVLAHVITLTKYILDKNAYIRFLENQLDTILKEISKGKIND